MGTNGGNLEEVLQRGLKDMPIKKPKVFISYAREDADMAMRLYHDLKKAAVEPWLDKECLLPGQRWSDAITDAIRTSDYFLALFSSTATSKRGYVQKELREAIEVLEQIPDNMIYVIPARLDECEPTLKKFAEFQRVDLFPDYDKSVEKILRVVCPPASLAVDDEADLSQAGWGVIFSSNCDPAIRKALAPLLDLRRTQAAKRHEQLFREFAAETGYKAGESYLDFLEANDMGPGLPDPLRVPTYLLIVGDPETIPFEFQYGLAVQYCVGRIHFDDIEGYKRYAATLVSSEKRRLKRRGRLSFFNTRHPGDSAMEMAHKSLVSPLHEALPKRFSNWESSWLHGEQASKQALLSLFQGQNKPDFLFIASHGMQYASGREEQTTTQGAILCADWPGFGTISSDHYCSASDLDDRVDLGGMIVLFFTAFSAGTPISDEYARLDRREAALLAPQAFVSPLPKHLLGRAGVSAVFGHVGTNFGYSFLWAAVPQIQTFEKAITALLSGNPVGLAHRYFSARYAELASQVPRQPDVGAEPVSKTSSIFKRRRIEIAALDARNLILLGDPASRIPVDPI